MNTTVVKTIVKITIAVLPIVLDLVNQENGEGKQEVSKQTARGGRIFAPSNNKNRILIIKSK